MAQVTRTINRLHFSDLDPLRFEDLCVALVYRLLPWKELNHFGRTGKDQGVDIHALESFDGSEKTWHFQCKRYQSVSKTDITKIFAAIANNQQPDKFVLIISCDISRDNYNYFKQNCEQLGIKDSEVWTASTLETRLYKDFTDLLFIYFGINTQKKKVDNAARVRYALKMKKRMQKDFFRHDALNDSKNWDLFQYEPYYKFISHTVFIRSVDDETYPEVITEGPNESQWFKTVLYDFYHNGIEVWLSAASGHKAIIDKNGYWDLLEDYHDPRQNDPRFTVKRVKIIAQIPFYSIVDYTIDGDEYNSEPHIFCKYQHNGNPYEKIYYRQYGLLKEKWYPYELDETKRKKL